MVYPTLLPLMCTPRLPVVDWTDAPADLNGLVRFAERRNLISARVPSHFRRSILRQRKMLPLTWRFVEGRSSGPCMCMNHHDFRLVTGKAIMPCRTDSSISREDSWRHYIYIYIYIYIIVCSLHTRCVTRTPVVRVCDCVCLLTN